MARAGRDRRPRRTPPPAHRRRLGRRPQRRRVRRARLRAGDREPRRALLPPAVGDRGAARELRRPRRALPRARRAPRRRPRRRDGPRSLLRAQPRAGAARATSSCSGAARRCPTTGTGRKYGPWPADADEYLRPLTAGRGRGRALVQRGQPSARGARSSAARRSPMRAPWPSSRRSPRRRRASAPCASSRARSTTRRPRTRTPRAPAPILPGLAETRRC